LFIRASLEAGGVEATSSKEEIRMKLHGSHRTCPSSRQLICERVLAQRWSVRQAAEAAGCSERTAAKWLARYRAGDRLLVDRSSRPRRSPRQLSADRVAAIERLRRVRMTAGEIAEVLGLPVSTVSLWLKRIGLGKRSRLEPLEPPNRYERRHPGELVHVDIKQLSRISVRGAGHRITGERSSQRRPWIDGRHKGITGYEYLHVIIDDHSRLAYAEVLTTLTARDAAAFLRRAIAWYAARGVRVKALMSDNGAAYISRLYARTLNELGLRHLRIKPGRPRTNGKAERLIQTLLNEWAYARLYGSSSERTAALPLYLDRYNYQRPHGSLSHQPPASRLNNLLGNYN
jgi:transposase InsO family protein